MKEIEISDKTYEKLETAAKELMARSPKIKTLDRAINEVIQTKLQIAMIEQFIKEHPESGYSDVNKFYEDAGRRLLALLKNELTRSAAIKAGGSDSGEKDEES